MDYYGMVVFLRERIHWSLRTVGLWFAYFVPPTIWLLALSTRSIPNCSSFSRRLSTHLLK